MGPTPISTSMKTYLLFAAVIAFTLAFSFAEEQFSDELMLSEVKAQINEVKKKGATEADCKNLADTTCKEVETERHQDQTVINRLKTGRNCDNLGQGSVRKATSHWQRTKRTHQVWKIRVTKASNAYVSFTSRSFSSLKEGKCGFIFMSRSYLQAKARHIHAVRVEVSWRGRVSEAWKMVIRMKMVAKKMVHRCRCATKTTFLRVWRTVTNAKCKMMRCVLDGTPLTSSKCKANLKKLVKKKLTKATESVRGCRQLRAAAEKKRRALAEKKRRASAEKKEKATALQIYHRTQEMKKKAAEKVAKLKRSNEKKKKEKNIKRKER